MRDPRPPVIIDLKGPEGNSMVILAKCCTAARMAGWSAGTVMYLQREMLGGDRGHLLDVLFECFDVMAPVVAVYNAEREKFS